MKEAVVVTEAENPEEIVVVDDNTPDSDARASSMTAPYASFTSFKNLLDKLAEDGIPGRFDKSYFGNISGSLVAQTRGTLRYFELMDEEQYPTDRLKSLVEADEAARSQMIRDMLEERYADALALSPNATSGQLADVFRERGLNGATVVKAMNFFLAMAEASGVTVSPHFKKGRVVASNGGTRKKRPAKGTTTPPADPPPPPADNVVTSQEAQRAKYVDMLMSIAAKSDGEMPSTDLLDRIEKAIGLAVVEPKEAPTHDSP